jgi:hypothetical protein
MLSKDLSLRLPLRWQRGRGEQGVYSYKYIICGFHPLLSIPLPSRERLRGGYSIIRGGGGEKEGEFVILPSRHEYPFLLAERGKYGLPRGVYPERSVRARNDDKRK